MAKVYVIVKTDFEYDDQNYIDQGGTTTIQAYLSEKKAEAVCLRLNVEWFTNPEGLRFPYDFVYNLDEAFSDGFIWFFGLKDTDFDVVSDKFKEIMLLLKPEQRIEVLEKHIQFPSPYRIMEVAYDEND